MSDPPRISECETEKANEYQNGAQKLSQNLNFVTGQEKNRSGEKCYRGQWRRDLGDEERRESFYRGAHFQYSVVFLVPKEQFSDIPRIFLQSFVRGYLVVGYFTEGHFCRVFSRLKPRATFFGIERKTFSIRIAAYDLLKTGVDSYCSILVNYRQQFASERTIGTEIKYRVSKWMLIFFNIRYS